MRINCLSLALVAIVLAGCGTIPSGGGNTSPEPSPSATMMKQSAEEFLLGDWTLSTGGGAGGLTFTSEFTFGGETVSFENYPSFSGKGTYKAISQDADKVVIKVTWQKNEFFEANEKEEITIVLDRAKGTIQLGQKGTYSRKKA